MAGALWSGLDMEIVSPGPRGLFVKKVFHKGQNEKICVPKHLA
jgi:hypothetical protein